jgi:diadenosine tetraphosphatase ApaH/serine/threonine PP2A family protein phosphatase
MDISSILLPFSIFVAIWYFCGHFGIPFPFWYVLPRKIWQTSAGGNPFAGGRQHFLRNKFYSVAVDQQTAEGRVYRTLAEMGIRRHPFS